MTHETVRFVHRCDRARLPKWVPDNRTTAGLATIGIALTGLTALQLAAREPAPVTTWLLAVPATVFLVAALAVVILRLSCRRLERRGRHQQVPRPIIDAWRILCGDTVAISGDKEFQLLESASRAYGYAETDAQRETCRLIVRDIMQRKIWRLAGSLVAVPEHRRGQMSPVERQMADKYQEMEIM